MSKASTRAFSGLAAYCKSRIVNQFEFWSRFVAVRWAAPFKDLLQFGGARATCRLFILSPNEGDDVGPALLREIGNAVWALGMKFNIATEADA